MSHPLLDTRWQPLPPCLNKDWEYHFTGLLKALATWDGKTTSQRIERGREVEYNAYGTDWNKHTSGKWQGVKSKNNQI